MKFLVILLFFFLTTAYAQSPWYFGTGEAVNLTNGTKFANGIKNISGALNPTATAVNAPAGSMYFATTGIIYVKQDAGSTTNWTALGFGSGNVVGPASATSNAIPRFNLTTGKILKDSGVIISDAGVITSPVTNGDVTIQPNGSGLLQTASIRNIGRVTNALSQNIASTLGENSTLKLGVAKNMRLNNFGLLSVSLLETNYSGAIPPLGGQEITLVNVSGHSIMLNNLTGTATSTSKQINTGMGRNYTLAERASVSLVYNDQETVWEIIAPPTYSKLDLVYQTPNGPDSASWTTGNNATFLGAGTISGIFTDNTATPLQGSGSYKYTQAAGSLNDYVVSRTQAVPKRFRGNNAVVTFPYTYDGADNDMELIVYDVTNAAIINASVQKNIKATGATQGFFRMPIVIPATCLNIRFGFRTRVLNSGKIFEFASLEASSNVLADVSTVTAWQSYTPTFTGFGSPSAIEFFWRQVGENIEVKGKFTSGVSTTTEARISLPNNYTSAGVSKIPTIQVAGYAGKNASTVTVIPLIEPSATYLTFGQQIATGNGAFTKTNGDSLVVNGSQLGFTATVPVAGLQGVTSIYSLPSQDTSRVGEIIFSSNPTAPSGFISALTSSIGLSGATFNGESYYSLYENLWNLAGTTTTAGHVYRISSAKGASALADWTALKTITIDYATNGAFIRAKTAARGAGAYESSDNLSHRHNLYSTNAGGAVQQLANAASAAVAGVSAGTGFSYVQNAPANGNPYVDVSGGTESKPNAVSLYVYIRFSASSEIIIGKFNGLESCADSTVCTSNFSAVISPAATTSWSSEGVNFIASCGNGSTGDVSCIYKTPIFTVVPSVGCTINAVDAGGTLSCAVTASSSSGFTVRTKYHLTSGATGPNPYLFTVFVNKAGVDAVASAKTALAVASDANIKSIGSVGVDVQSLNFGSGAVCGTTCTTGSCSLCNKIGSKITAVNWIGVGIYQPVGIDLNKYNCTGAGTSSGGILLPLAYDRTVNYLYARSGSTATDINTASLICIGIP